MTHRNLQKLCAHKNGAYFCARVQGRDLVFGHRHRARILGWALEKGCVHIRAQRVPYSGTKGERCLTFSQRGPVEFKAYPQTFSLSLKRSVLNYSASSSKVKLCAPSLAVLVFQFHHCALYDSNSSYSFDRICPCS